MHCMKIAIVHTLVQVRWKYFLVLVHAIFLQTATDKR